MTFIFYVLLMALITFTCRYFFFANVVHYSLHPEIKRLLKFTAPAVLTAMWAPIIFVSDGHLNSVDNVYFISGIITILAAILIPRTLPVIVIGLISFGVLRFFTEATILY
jgi:branched-subunit amino acid transport protein